MEKNHEKCCPISTIVILRLMILQLTKAVAENISMTSKTITFKILQSAIKLRPSMQLISLKKISYYSSTTIKSELSSPISSIDLHIFV